MDFTNIVLVQIAIFYCLAILLPTSRSNSSLKIAAIVVLIILSMSWYYRPDLMMKIGIGAWIGLVLLPMMLLRRLESLVNNSQYLAASRLARWLRWLVPTDGMWTYHHLLSGLALAQTGQIDAAHELFDRYQPNHSAGKRAIEQPDLGRSATALLYRSTDRWSEYIEWVQAQMTQSRLPSNELGAALGHRGTILVYYLRALAETGDLRRCIAEVAKLDRSRQLNTQSLNILKLYILAYCGRVEALEQSSYSLLSTYSADVHQFWLATAELAAGNVESATEQLIQLRQTTADSCIRHDIDWRLSQPLPDLDKLNQFDWETVAEIEMAAVRDARYSNQTPISATTPVTNLLIAINVLVFGVELLWQLKTGNKDFNTNFWVGDKDALFNVWGGLTGSLVLAGQWWRIITANFLHMGIAHLGLNMLGLFYLGKFVEHRLGSVRYLFAYLVAGLGSMAVITYIDTKLMTPNTTVGASGAIMGMLGAVGAIHLNGWRQSKVAAAGRQFQTVLFSVALQLVFDITNGHTSIVGHFSGLTIGFLVGMALLQFGDRDLPRLPSS
ncbi:rhomboid family intramembrane serine protease [Chamaesiphon sp. VAR_69_metabat_338]|uniref:rhomboid family intramembrane serine protease n=1 Tax=Chamaesiphon sp. VAR_69_metabat_338 TaxID=2964704 RepID=UPI00286EAD1A|nr:rhomboid family intramembrane serine protease [Chamaesiphon sp. VAR_69_metabat_338]